MFLLLFALTPLDSVIEHLQAHYNGLQSLRATFVQVYRENEHASNRPEETGVVYLQKPGKMRWDYNKPETKQFFCDGKEAYFYAPADKQATRFSVKESNDVRVPLRFLLGKLNLKRIFAKVELAADMAPIDPGDTVLKLWPKKGENFHQVYLEIDGFSRIRRLVIDEDAGSRSDFRLSAEEANPRLESSWFKFTPPSGVQVVDERSQ